MTALERRAPVGFIAAGGGLEEQSLEPNSENNPDALNVDLGDQ